MQQHIANGITFLSVIIISLGGILLFYFICWQLERTQYSFFKPLLMLELYILILDHFGGLGNVVIPDLIVSIKC
jgi:hypothetical protein